jgi:tRNA G18 (ribose-2'-O)-methylase SpoU
MKVKFCDLQKNYLNIKDEVDKNISTVLNNCNYILGNEVEGISDEALQNIDSFIEIPQLGTKHSLNVSVCGGIVMWVFAKALK